ncbi:MAG: DUF4097 domain-containing protein [Chloroflexi bacterium]|nr:DUF4097 domain-containing protein [Chloroflexota bacterium]
MYTQTFQLAPECTVQIDAFSSDITISGSEGQQVRLETEDQSGTHVECTENRLHINAQGLASGDIRLAVPATCELHVNTLNGDITGRHLGKATLASTAGDIDLSESAGNIVIHNVSGDVSISGAEITSLAIETVSGDIQCKTALEQDGKYSLHTISGDIRLQLPPDERCLVLYQTLSGDLTCGLPHQTHRQGWGKMDIAVNDGGVTVHCSSTSGDLNIEPSERARQAAPAQEAPAHPRPTRPLGPFDLGDTTPPASAAPQFKTRLEVLKAIEEGRLSVSDGLALLQKLL